MARSDLEVPSRRAVAFEGTRDEIGFLQGTRHSWKQGIGHKVEQGGHVHRRVDDQGQINLVNAVFTCIGDNAAVTLVNLAVALDELPVILACYPGTVHKTPIEFAFAPEEIRK